MSGYNKLPEQTAEAFAGGWMHTGDIGRFDDEGFLYIIDRKKDMVVSGGFNVFPREVEDVLAADPAVAQVAVIGVPDERWGEAVKALFGLIFDVVESLQGRFQVLITDHPDFSDDARFQAALRERWRDGLKFVPEDWPRGGSTST